MRTWLPPNLRRSAPGTPPLERLLKEARPKIQFPTSLHGSIMDAVRVGGASVARQDRLNETRPEAGSFAGRWWWWLTAPSTAVLLGLAVWSFRWGEPQENSAPLYAASAALEVGDQLTRQMPALAVAPLTDELERLRHDLESATQFLAASVP